MKHDEGYIKFIANWEPSVAFRNNTITNLNQWRQKLFDVHLIGAYPDGVGFGNVSHRAKGNHFFISGSKTGNLETLSNEHYSKVIDFDISRNMVNCIGPVIASSESMSHAMIYQELDWVQAVFHVHSLELWTSVLHNIPTTPASAAYGTPEMATEITRLIKETSVCETKVFAMAGHKEGLFSFGRNLEEAGAAILSLENQVI
ncbi:MAG: class II aldolase/adducin family protein [Saprospiraceae bacterium]